MGADSSHIFDDDLQLLKDTINRVNTSPKQRQHQTINIVLSDDMQPRRSLVDRFLQLFE